MSSQIPSPCTSPATLISLGRYVKNELWLSRFLYQLDLHLRLTEFVQEDEHFQFLRNAFSSSLRALQEEGILSEEVFGALQRASESASEDLLTAQAAWCWGLSLGKRALYVTRSKERAQTRNGAPPLKQFAPMGVFGGLFVCVILSASCARLDIVAIAVCHHWMLHRYEGLLGVAGQITRFETRIPLMQGYATRPEKEITGTSAGR